MWSLLFHGVFCGLNRYRKKDDNINLAIAGFSVAFFLNVRSGGIKSSITGAIVAMLTLLWIRHLVKRAEQYEKQQQLNKNIEYTKSRINKA